MRRRTLLIVLLPFILYACSSTGIREELRTSEYKIRKGDTLYSIAWRYRLDYRELAHWNGIAPPYTIYPGDALRMRPPVRAGSNRAGHNVIVQNTQPVHERPVVVNVKPSTKPQAAPVTKSVPARHPPQQMNTQTATSLAWRWPTEGKVVTSFSNKTTGRKGINIEGKTGQRVDATAEGKVVYSGSGLIGYGKLIIINHNKKFLSAYAHNRKLLVREGESVHAGQKIAELGSTDADRPMLHFEIRLNGRPVDPLKYLPKR